MIIQSITVVGGLALAFGLGLAVAAKKFAVKVDERVSKVREVLPGVNCGACGAAGCDAFADGVVEGKFPVDGCIPGQKAVADKISSIMGSEAGAEKEKTVAQLHCNGNNEHCKPKFDYKGIKTCKAASLIQSGYKSCSYACLGFGDCDIVCPVDAITMQSNGLPKLNKNKCIACGKCVAECPKNLYDLVPLKSKVHVLCSSKDINKVTMKSCKVGCIACKLCEKACPLPDKAITVNDNLATIDYSKCVSCGKCVDVCPRKIILNERSAK